MLDDNKIAEIIKIQRKYPNLLLCGSAALIMTGLLPNRAMSDIDFVVNYKDLPHTCVFSSLKVDPYPNSAGDNYESYSAYYKMSSKRVKLNLLVFKDDVKLNNEVFGSIKHQSIDDIIYWKRKYNRPKDIKDLESIAINLIEEALEEQE